MAQWNGQYTGNTHGTRVTDFEQTLRHAIDVFKTASDEMRSNNARAVKKLAAKVLNARLKMVKAKLSDTIPAKAEDLEKRIVQIEHLTILERNLQAAGVDGILIEFGMAELLADDHNP